MTFTDNPMVEEESYEYDIALSFAGEDRSYVEQVARILVAEDVRVFYDSNERAVLWGKDLYVHLGEVYSKRARFTLLFASAHYAKKVWTNHERRNAQSRAFIEQREYILPARFDDTEIPGLLPTIGTIDLRVTTPRELADLVLQKLGRQPNDWEPNSPAPMPGESQPKTDSLHTRANQLRDAAARQERREQILQSQEGVTLANREVEHLREYLSKTITELASDHKKLGISLREGRYKLMTVLTVRACFTMHWGLDGFASSLRDATLFVRQSHIRIMVRKTETFLSLMPEVRFRFDVDDAKTAGWRDPNRPNELLMSKQLVDRLVGEVVELTYRGL